MLPMYVNRKTKGTPIISPFMKNNFDVENSMKNYASIFNTPIETQLALSTAEMGQYSRAVSFQVAMKPPIILGQIFSLFPHAYGKKSKSLLSWFYLKYVYAIISICGQIFLTFMSIYSMIYVSSSLKATTSLVFYSTSLVSMLMFFYVTRKWRQLILRVEKLEMIDPNFNIELYSKIKITCLIVMTLALAEHILSLLPAFVAGKLCRPPILMDSYEAYARHFYPNIFTFIPYNVVLAFMSQFFHVQSTFIWNYSDLFVICVSFYLTSRLDQVNNKLKGVSGKSLPDTFWRSIREEYSRATQLVRKVDDAISGIVFISFANNLFFICLQLFYTVVNGVKGRFDCETKGNVSHSVGGYVSSGYFIYSLVFLISRSIMLSLIAARVNTASTVPASILYEVPSTSYCTEVQRFIDQANYDKVALTGLQFFSVTRGLILTVAATIVTYELVMFQFNSPSTSVTSFPDNSTTAVP